MIGVPVARGDLRGQVLPPLFCEVLLRGDQDLRIGVELEELAAEPAQACDLERKEAVS